MYDHRCGQRDRLQQAVNKNRTCPCQRLFAILRPSGAPKPQKLDQDELARHGAATNPDIHSLSRQIGGAAYRVVASTWEAQPQRRVQPLYSLRDLPSEEPPESHPRVEENVVPKALALTVIVTLVEWHPLHHHHYLLGKDSLGPSPFLASVWAVHDARTGYSLRVRCSDPHGKQTTKL